LLVINSVLLANKKSKSYLLRKKIKKRNLKSKSIYIMTNTSYLASLLGLYNSSINLHRPKANTDIHNILITMSLTRLVPVSSLHCLICPSIVLFIFSNFFPSFAHPLSVNITYFGHDASNIAYNVRIAYNATAKNLGVFWTYEENHLIRGSSFLPCSIDLKEVHPADQVIIGFLAATSSNLEWHPIHSCDFYSNTDSLELRSNKKRGTFLAVYVAVVFLILMLVVGVITWLVLVKRRRSKIDSHGDDAADSVSSINTDLERGSLPRKFSYVELVAATEGFANNRRLGQGGSGHVYKGDLGDLGRPVAVKRICTECQHSRFLFINEVKIISRLIHRNLVQFIGWCHERGEFLLVYEHMPNGSLDNHLFGNGETLPWNVRYKIALGLASALHYLHEEAENCVLHRDIKSANVLLDADFNTKLGDFGVAELVDPQLKIHSTGVVGTYGYLAPEYVNEGKASKASDVFSFGVVALELACGRRTYQDGEFHVSLVRWIWQLYLAGDILNAADERLSLCMSFNQDEMRRLLIVGLWCTHPNYKERPKTEQVIKVLQLEAPLPELPRDMHHPVFQTISPPQGQGDSFQPSITSSLNYGGR
jgi:serine/threonine protein kinase